MAGVVISTFNVSNGVHWEQKLCSEKFYRTFKRTQLAGAINCVPCVEELFHTYFLEFFENLSAFRIETFRLVSRTKTAPACSYETFEQ